MDWPENILILNFCSRKNLKRVRNSSEQNLICVWQRSHILELWVPHMGESLSYDSWVMTHWVMIIVYNFWRVHCFNNFENNQNCVDMEVSYFVECNKKVSRSSEKNLELPCFIPSQANLTEQNVLVLSTKRNQPISSPTTSTQYLRTNVPMTIPFTGTIKFFYRIVKKIKVIIII